VTTTGIGGSGGSGIVIVRYYVGNGSWSSSNTAIATVDASGLVTAVSGGSATISYTISGVNSCSGSISNFGITINQSPSIISISPP
jgi:uncharacterized protein YjdB